MLFRDAVTSQPEFAAAARLKVIGVLTYLDLIKKPPSYEQPKKLSRNDLGRKSTKEQALPLRRSQWPISED